MDNNRELAEMLAENTRLQFEQVAEEKGLTYEKDFEAFAVGYALGVMDAIKSEIESKRRIKGC